MLPRAQSSRHCSPATGAVQPQSQRTHDSSASVSAPGAARAVGSAAGACSGMLEGDCADAGRRPQRSDREIDGQPIKDADPVNADRIKCNGNRMKRNGRIDYYSRWFTSRRQPRGEYFRSGSSGPQDVYGGAATYRAIRQKREQEAMTCKMMRAMGQPPPPPGGVPPPLPPAHTRDPAPHYGLTTPAPPVRPHAHGSDDGCGPRTSQHTYRSDDGHSPRTAHTNLNDWARSRATQLGRAWPMARATSALREIKRYIRRWWGGAQCPTPPAAGAAACGPSD